MEPAIGQQSARGRRRRSELVGPEPKSTMVDRSSAFGSEASGCGGQGSVHVAAIAQRVGSCFTEPRDQPVATLTGPVTDEAATVAATPRLDEAGLAEAGQSVTKGGRRDP